MILNGRKDPASWYVLLKAIDLQTATLTEAVTSPGMVHDVWPRPAITICLLNAKPEGSLENFSVIESLGPSLAS